MSAGLTLQDLVFIVKIHKSSTAQLLKRLKRLNVSISLEQLRRLQEKDPDPESLCASLPEWSQVSSHHRGEVLKLMEVLLHRLGTPQKTLSRHLWHGQKTIHQMSSREAGITAWTAALKMIPVGTDALPESWTAVLEEVFEKREGIADAVDAWAHQFCVCLILEAAPQRPTLTRAVEVRGEILSRLGAVLSLLGQWLVEVDEIPMLAMHKNIPAAEAVFRRCVASRPGHPYAYVRWAEALGVWGDDLEQAAQVIAEGERQLAAAGHSTDWGLADLHSDLDLPASE
ncbi:MAG: hypothetical protein ACI8S6_001918 [Myxococcota bacterium]|jgi:hypothetical protein